jgi:hypothetical protein
MLNMGSRTRTLYAQTKRPNYGALAAARPGEFYRTVDGEAATSSDDQVLVAPPYKVELASSLVHKSNVNESQSCPMI